MKIRVGETQKALVFRKGLLSGILGTGDHRFMPWDPVHVEMVDLREPFTPVDDLKIYTQHPDVGPHLALLDLADGQLALRKEDGKIVQVLSTGCYAFWKGLRTHTWEIFSPGDVNEIKDQLLLTHPMVSPWLDIFEVQPHETGLYFEDHEFKGLLDPGRHGFWRGPIKRSLEKVDLRSQTLDLSGQEMMSADKVTLRVNFFLTYQVKDAVKYFMLSKNPVETLYLQAQLVLREYVGTLKLDDLLSRKEDLAQFVLGRLKNLQENYGVEFHSAGLKDIILPGEIKEILNLVLVAEKRAQANFITRREETASTRNLLNTAKLLEENPVLYRLKEMEYLEKVAEKVSSLTLTGGTGLLEALNSLISSKGPQA